MLILGGTLSFLGPFCVFDPEQMDGEAGDDIQHLGLSITLSWDLILKIQQQQNRVSFGKCRYISFRGMCPVSKKQLATTLHLS